MKDVAFFTIGAKLTLAVVLDLNKKIGGSTDLAKKRHGSADLHIPIHPLNKIYT